MLSETFPFKRFLDLTPYLKGREVISSGICYDGTLAVLAVASADCELPFERTENAMASFPVTSTSRAFPATFMRFGAELLTEVDLPPSCASYPLVQVFPDGSILLVSSRCSKTAEGPELNAAVYSPAGEMLREFCLGDGIQDLRVSAKGEIWASYFDEGIFGNFGWYEDGVGVSGLCCFDALGNVTWEFNKSGDLQSIDDCMAMSLCGGDMVACYYSSFTIVRVNQDKHTDAWSNEVEGATAIAVSGGEIIMYGGYGDESIRCIAQQLGSDGAVHNSRKVELEFPENYVGETIVGRDNELHVVVAGCWYKCCF